MISFFKYILNLFILTSVFITLVYFYIHILARIIVKIRLSNYFENEDNIWMIIFLSLILTYLTFRLCQWFFKRLKEQG